MNCHELVIVLDGKMWAGRTEKPVVTELRLGRRIIGREISRETESYQKLGKAD